MKQMIRKGLCILMAVAVMLSSISAVQAPVWAKTKDSGQKVGRAAKAAATVTTAEQFINALKAGNSPITVDGAITLVNGADADNRMLPVVIPENTMIQGTTGSSITCRSPIQLGGDGVSFKNIELTFNSSDAMGSVPHREIFLAGHQLTLDNVSTYLKGGNGAPGSLVGSEQELLPTVYGGGYSNTTVGANASLIVKNSNSKTMFKAIYMGHQAESDNKVPYMGNAVLNLDANATVREGVDTSYNNYAQINISGGTNQSVQAREFFGNENTSLTITTTQLTSAMLDNVGSIVLEGGAYLAPKATDWKGEPLQSIALQNVTLKSGSCLEFPSAGSSVVPAVISGDFTGVEGVAADRATLVLTQKNTAIGTLTINGNVTGSTQLNINGRSISSMPLATKAYIYAKAGSGVQPNFVLPQNIIDNGVGLHYANGAWTVYRGTPPTEETTVPTQGTTTSPTTAPTQKPTTSPTDQTTAPTEGSTTAPTKPTTPPTQGTTTSPANPTTVPTGGTIKPTTPTSGTPPTGPTVTPPSQKPEDHRHQYQSSVTKQATCTEAGTRTYTCTCGHTYAESIAPSGHQYAQERIPATSKADGKVQKVCRVCSHITDVYVISRPRNPSWSKAEFTYDGKVKRPEVSIRDSKGGELVPGSDYEVHYPKAMKNPGIYTAVIEFCGDYSGRMTKTITIKPKAASLKKLTSKSRGFQATWKKQTVQMDGYQIQYGTGKTFKGKEVKTVTVKKTAAAKSIKKLKGKTKYYVRIRTYKTVRVSGETKKLYSDWSGIKSVYTKR